MISALRHPNLGFFRVANRPLELLLGLALIQLTSGCSSVPIPRATCSDQAFADYIHTQAERLPIAGVHELRATAAGGHVTLGGRVDSPETLREVVRAVANTPGLTQLSFYGVEFEPPDVPDDEIIANARRAAAAVLGDEIASKLGYYCEDHRLFVFGTLPSLPMRERLEEAMRQVRGVGLYHVTCEVVLPHPPADPQVVAAVKKKFRRALELPNITFRASQVQVTSVNNVVYLTGKAPTLLGKLSAGAQAAQVEGVRYVVNKIEVPGIRITDAPRPEEQSDESLKTADRTGPNVVDLEIELDDDVSVEAFYLAPVIVR